MWPENRAIQTQFEYISNITYLTPHLVSHSHREPRFTIDYPRHAMLNAQFMKNRANRELISIPEAGRITGWGDFYIRSHVTRGIFKSKRFIDRWPQIYVYRSQVIPYCRYWDAQEQMANRQKKGTPK